LKDLDNILPKLSKGEPTAMIRPKKAKR